MFSFSVFRATDVAPHRSGLGIVQLPFDFAVALSDLGLVELVKLQGLREGKKMFLPVVAFQTTGDLFFRLLHPVIFERRQLPRVAFSRQDSADDGQSREPAQVAQDVMQAEVHLRQRLLHVLNVGASGAHQVFPVAQVAAQHADFVLGAEAPTQ